MRMQCSMRILSYMNRVITQRFRHAVRYTTVNIGELARESGYAHVTFDKYLNERPPTVPASLALADALERRAAKLTELALGLREATGERHGGTPA